MVSSLPRAVMGGALLAGLGFAAGQLYQRADGASSDVGSSRPEASGPSPHDSDDGNAAAIAALQRRMRDLEQARAATATEPSSEEAAAEGVPPDSLSPAPSPQEEVADNEVAAAALTTRLRAEPRDAAWAAATESEVRAAVARGLPGRLEEVECGSTFCSAEFTHESAADRDAFMARVAGETPFATDGQIRTTAMSDSGQSRCVIFFARAGERVPQITNGASDRGI